MEVHVVDALSDNYMYLIVDKASRTACCVDAVDAQGMVAEAKRVNANISMVLTTHHHFDHAGGNNECKKLIPGVEIVGGERDAIQGMTRPVKDGDVLNVGATRVECIWTPCHTAGHISYAVHPPDGSPAALFSGDFLFVGGCGRFFEGGPDEMAVGLARLARLPPETLVYCGHEYTVKNLQFALSVEPDNEAAQRKIVWAQEARSRGERTVPSTLGDELRFNPFMRSSQPVVCAFTGAQGDVAVLRVLRNKKDSFAGSSRPWIPGGGPLPGL